MNRKKLWTAISFLAVLFTSNAQTNDWENPSLFEINKEPARATALPYNDQSIAVADKYERSPCISHSTEHGSSTGCCDRPSDR